MTNTAFSKTALYEDITQLIKGAPASPISTLPPIWQRLAKSVSGTKLSDKARLDYVEAAQLFRYHNTVLNREALSAIGNDFLTEVYPDFNNLPVHENGELSAKMNHAVKDLFATFGYDVPASFYHLLLETVADHTQISIKMFRDRKTLLQDRLWDAVLHASLLVTPIGLYVQSIMSQHGIRFTHMMDCSCRAEISVDKAFSITLDADLKSAYLQNMIAASFEQYGVNAETSREKRGF